MNFVITNRDLKNFIKFVILCYFLAWYLQDDHLRNPNFHQSKQTAELRRLNAAKHRDVIRSRRYELLF